MIEQKFFSVLVNTNDGWGPLEVRTSLNGIVNENKLLSRIKNALKDVLADNEKEAGRAGIIGRIMPVPTIWKKSLDTGDITHSLKSTFQSILDEINESGWEVIQMSGPHQKKLQEHERIKWEFLVKRIFSSD